VGHPKTGRAPFPGCLWCLSRPFVRAGAGRKRYDVPGALNAVTHEVIRVCNEGYVTADTVCALLRTLPASGLRVPVAVVLDNARYLRCEPVQAPARRLGIHLLYLPSYSPNLNLIERLWRFVRKQSLNSTWFDLFEQFQAAIDDCLDEMATDHHRDLRCRDARGFPERPRRLTSGSASPASDSTADAKRGHTCDVAMCVSPLGL
jgi:transposase